MLTKTHLLLCLFTLNIALLQGQVLINEVCTANETTFADADGDYPDWIELYNAGTQSVQLGGFFLSDDDDEPQKWTFPNLTIAPGNFLLVFASDKDEVNQYAHTNFKLSKDGEYLALSDATGTVLDFLIIPALEEDQSFGRQPDGSEEWVYFDQTSPAFTNNNQTGIRVAAPPLLATDTYFYAAPTSITLSCGEPACEVRFTRDGSIPDENSERYTEPIRLDTSTVIRAVTFAPDYLPSSSKVRSFFIQESHELPIVAMTTSPEYLWDENDGIFVLGPDAAAEYPFEGANFWKDTEIPMHLEYFNEEKNLEVEYDLAAKNHGGRSARTKPMKSVRFLAKATYGTDIMDYSFFKNKDLHFFERLVLRNASGDYNICHLRDPFLSRYFIDEKLDLDAVAYQPVVVYINGAYWGVMGLREKVDRFYLQYNHDVDPDALDLLEEDTLVVEGDFSIFNEMENFVMENEMNDAATFEVVDSFFDLKNIADYFIAQTAVNNTDWPQNNLKYWRERKVGAKWRYILFDMDAAMSRGAWTRADKNSFGLIMDKTDIRHVRLFRKLMENENYRFYFLNRYADLLNTTFQSDYFAAEVQRSKDMIDSEMARHLPRWGKTYEKWDTHEIPKLFEFTRDRPPFARQFLMDFFELSHEVLLELKTHPEGAGNIRINTIQPEQLPWEGYYFSGVPVELTIEANPGYTFSHWETTSGLKLSSETLRQDFQMDEVVVAIFDHSYEGTHLQLSPNPAHDNLQFSFELAQWESVQIKVYNPAGQLVLPEINKMGTTGNNQFSIALESLSTGIYFLQVKGNDFSTTKRFVKI